MDRRLGAPGRRVARGVSFLASLLLLPQPSSARETLDVQRFRPTASPNRVVTMDLPERLKAKRLGAGMMCNLADDPLVVRSEEGYEVALVEDQFNCDMLFALGLFGRGELGLSLPIILGMSGDPAQTLPAGEGAGVGDARVRGKMILAEWAEGPRLAGAVELSLPSGDEEVYQGDPGIGASLELLAAWRRGIFDIAASLGARRRPKPSPAFANMRGGDELSMGLGLVLTPSEELPLQGALEISSATGLPGGGAFGGTAETASELRGELRWWANPSFSLFVGGGVPLLKGVGTPRFRVQAGLYFSLREADADQDGLIDEKDGCPQKAEDLDGFQDSDGCPDPDNDADGVLDVNDRCPDELEDLDGYRDEDGCPDEDNDGDGVSDLEDGCPSAAEDADGYMDDDGCPEEDNDRDGLNDDVDQCPFDGEDPDDFQDADGCPDRDNDADGILDASDRCPFKPEIYNGIDDADGCPDEGQGQISLDGGQIRMRETVEFEEGEAYIDPKSYPALDKVAVLLKTHKRIRKVRVEGHTQATGDHEFDKVLSEARAQAVLAYLLDAGVSNDILKAVGFGGTQPLGGEDAAANNRVVFVVEKMASLDY